MKQISIIGCGLIGGSFAALIKENQHNIQVHGIDPSEDSLSIAKQKGWLDNYSTSIEFSSIENSDIILITAPISTVLDVINKLNTIKKPLTIIECSSVKSFLDNRIVTDSHHDILSCHPMGGSDQQGVTAASASILANKPMIVFKQQISSIHNFFKSLTFKLVICDSFAQHDQWMRYISHGPYLLSVLIPGLLANVDQATIDQLSTICAGGFKDTTRVSNSPESWGVDVLLGNKAEMLALIDELSKDLSTIKGFLNNNDTEGLSDYLSKAKQTRQAIVWNLSK